MNADEPGPLLVRYDIDPRAELGLARLRTITAILALLGALAMLLGRVPVPVFIAALVAFLASAAWLSQARKARGRALNKAQFYLAVHARGIVLAEGAEPAWLPFRDISAIDIDEDRLDIVVERTTGAPVRLEPRYPGVAIHDLMHTLRNAWLAARDS